MQVDPQYDDVVADVRSYLSGRIDDLAAAGVSRESIAIDPGIGFGKTVQHNLSLINRLEELAGLGAPLVLGTSRKSFLGTLTGIEDPADRDEATAVTTALGFERGARVFRVHEVADSRVALSVAGAIVADQQWDEWLQDLNHGDSPG
jgi:dihydropteroate synthase